MANLLDRLKVLERLKQVSMPPLILFIDEGEITTEQQQQIDEARSRNRKVKILSWLEPS